MTKKTPSLKEVATTDSVFSFTFCNVVENFKLFGKRQKQKLLQLIKIELPNEFPGD